MKLKKWVQVVLVIISIISGIAMMYDIELSIIPFIVGSIVFTISTTILCSYSDLFNDLIDKLRHLCNK